MRVLLVGHDFDFSAGDGISRYSLEMYKGLRRYAEVSTIATGKLPRPARALLNINVSDADIVHLMYPDVAKVNKGKAKMVTTWHDLRMFNKYLEEGQYRVKPKLVERFNIANSIIRKWTLENYKASDGIVFNSSQTQKELKDYLSSQKVYDAGKIYAVTPLGVDAAFLRTKPWDGDRKDFVYMGSIHLRHKNLSGLLHIFNKIAAKHDVRLHIFTFSPNAQKLLSESMKGLGNLSSSNVILHYRVQDAVVSRYLQTAVAYLQLSKHEGLGMSIFAALACGTNVMVLKDSVMPREATKYVMRLSPDGVVRKASQMAENPRPAPKKAISYARSFTWERTVGETLALYRKVLAK
jgi:glycosyltransferase involved in cell wall biosynthesis